MFKTLTATKNTSYHRSARLVSIRRPLFRFTIVLYIYTRKFVLLLGHSGSVRFCIEFTMENYQKIEKIGEGMFPTMCR
jgi:hypothetical protein